MADTDFPLRFRKFRARDYHFKVARSRWELDGFWRIRQRIFCEEQGLFSDTDRDACDDTMIPLVAVSVVMGMEDRVVGVVRIDEPEPGIWFGSRLGVDPDFRRIGRMSGAASVGLSRSRRLGPELIYKAVSTAHALGCRRFFANVQSQNVRLFESLHWNALYEFEEWGIPHVRMEAELDHYPCACDADVAYLREAPAA